MSQKKRCPFCGGIITARATICRHCKRVQPQPRRASPHRHYRKRTRSNCLLIVGMAAVFLFGAIGVCCLVGLVWVAYRPVRPTSQIAEANPGEIQPSFTPPVVLPVDTRIPMETPTPEIIPSATQAILPTLTALPTLPFTSTPIATSTPNLPVTVSGCVPMNTKRETGVVTNVVDGDTIDVSINGVVYRVRYIGMDTPEQGDQYFTESTNTNRAMVAGKQVLVKDVSEVDRYDRLLRYVFVGETFVNYELVRQGYAQAATYPPDVACSDLFVDAQRDAVSTGAGLWYLPPTEPPVIVVEPTSPPSNNPVCSCSGNVYNCADFSTHAEAQACYEYCLAQGRGDVHDLDRDSDGSACESLP